MAVSILILTHDNVGGALLKAATRTIGKLPLQILTMPISYNCDPDITIPKVQDLVATINKGDGVLILTDLYGATPSNIAQKINDGIQVRVVSGINLPMLLKVLNYPDLDLISLANKATCGGQNGILDCCESTL